MTIQQQTTKIVRSPAYWDRIFSSPQAIRIAQQATRQAKQELDATPRHLLDPGNPNHPDNFTCPLFGYAETDFLRKQYKQGATA